jgi:hypothetical protein
MNTIIGILGRKFYTRTSGASEHNPIHIIAPILEWAGIVIFFESAFNSLYTEFVKYDFH